MNILNPHPKPSRTTFRGLPTPIWPPGPEMPRFWVTNIVNVKCGSGVQERQGGAQQSQSRVTAGPVVDWKHRGRTRAVEPGAYERYATLGLFGHRGMVAVSNTTGLQEACAAVNGFLKRRFPSGTWTSIAVRAHQSAHGAAPRHSEHVRAVESCASSGRVHGRACE